MYHLLRNVETLAGELVLPLTLRLKLVLYVNLRNTITELNSLRCYDGFKALEIIVKVKFYQERKIK